MLNVTNKLPRGKPRSIVQLNLSIFTQQATGNYTLKEIKKEASTVSKSVRICLLR